MAKSVFPLTNTCTLQGAFTRTDLHPAKINYFALHAQNVEGQASLMNCFAVVDWLEEHPLQSVAPLGNPFLLMCNDPFTNPRNFLIPVENIHSLTIPASYTFSDYSVLAITPLIL